LKHKSVLTDGDYVCVMKLMTRNRPAIDGGAVRAHQIFEKEDGLNLHDPGMMRRDGGILDHECIVGFPTDRQ
jgi:hypothetical protein